MKLTFCALVAELMQTELHHLQTLHIMAEVFRRGMKEEVQLDSEAVERVFPCLDQLLVFHHAFFAAMKERRHNSAQPPGHGNYLIQRIGDVLLQQVTTGYVLEQDVWRRERAAYARPIPAVTCWSRTSLLG